jgi:methionyl-tRNA formyltransferase
MVETSQNSHGFVLNNNMQKERKIIIVGGHEQACLTLEYLIENKYKIVLCVARQDDEGKDGIFPSLLLRAKKYDIPTIQPRKLNSPEVFSKVKRLNADIVLSLQNNMIFGKEWIRFFNEKLGIVNVHYAPLPMYSGYWPEMWAIWNGETEFAVTMHYVKKEVDAGRIIVQSFFELDKSETRKSLYEKSTKYCHEMLKGNLAKILEQKISGTEQDESKKTYYPRSLPNEGFLDLSWDEETQSRFIRAICFPGFVGPKIKIGNQIISLLEEDVPFFTPVKILCRNE